MRWIPQGFQWVDPQKEIAAVVLAIRAHLISRSEAIAEFGYDAETIDAAIAADNARMDRLGLVSDSDPRKTQRSGAAQQEKSGGSEE